MEEIEQTTVVAHNQPSSTTNFLDSKRHDQVLHSLIDSARFAAFIRRYEISLEKARYLMSLANFKIILVCDDSGSMQMVMHETKKTRWDYAKEMTQLIVKFATIFHQNGIDIYFLNRFPILNVKDPSGLDEVFADSPAGYTPLVDVLQYIFNHSANDQQNEKKSLIFVLTDGAPTDNVGNECTDELEILLREKRPIEEMVIHFVACTDEIENINYLSDWDQTMKNVFVTKDFNRERTKIKKQRGENYSFSLGDYIVELLAGPQHQPN